MSSIIRNCKMYQWSTNKSKIDCAIADPINKELIQQLDQYVTDDTIKTTQPSSSDKRSSSHILHVGKIKDRSDEDNSSKLSKPVRYHKDKSTMPATNKIKSFKSNKADTESQVADTDDTSTSLQPEPDVLDKSASPQSDVPDTSNTESDNPSTDIETADQLHSDYCDINPEDVKQYVLNLDSECKCNRVGITDKELWLYLDDSINLNTIMYKIIDGITRKYNQTTFNRLARSDNAIVFEVAR